MSYCYIFLIIKIYGNEFFPRTHIDVQNPFQLFLSVQFQYFMCVPCHVWDSLVAQRVKSLPEMQETWVRSLGQEDPLEKKMAIHSSTIAWKVPWTEKPGRLQSMGLKKVRHDWATSLSQSLMTTKILIVAIKKKMIIINLYWVVTTGQVLCRNLCSNYIR